MRSLHWLSVVVFGVAAFGCSKAADSPQAAAPSESAKAAPAADRQLTLTYFTMPG